MISGQCLCGSVRFEVAGPIGPIIFCHCSLCRRASGSAFGAGASTPASGFRVLAGEDSISEYQSSPNYVRAFCSKCGSPLFGRPLSWPEARILRLGTLEGDLGEKPRAAIWTSSGAPWYEASSDLDRFPEEPPPRYYSFDPSS
ncbi:MAG: glutathione-dependent formaldehyde-activating [Deltaproteobacteria bacterium]|nr:glutathione-dependent formaldehyde-activating [Deltaproteobacteria bacterium]MBP1774518.1 glutathione-dependent formaldehyde-activating [candidate division NC10 bacterium]